MQVGVQDLLNSNGINKGHAVTCFEKAEEYFLKSIKKKNSMAKDCLEQLRGIRRKYNYY